MFHAFIWLPESLGKRDRVLAVLFKTTPSTWDRAARAGKQCIRMYFCFILRLQLLISKEEENILHLMPIVHHFTVI